MNKLKTTLFAACSLVLVTIGTSVKADSSNFAGPYIGISASGYGMQIAGEAKTSPTVAGVKEIAQVSLGQVAPVTGFEVGYAIPIGSAFLIDIGASMFQGEAKLEYHHDQQAPSTCAGCTTGTVGPKNVSFTIDDLVNYYIAPTLVLSDTSSLYVKVGLTEADIGVSGDITTPSNLSGTTWALGTRTVLESGIFIKTEAGYTDYNEISAHGQGNNIDSDNRYSTKPTIAFGTVALGFRF